MDTSFSPELPTAGKRPDVAPGWLRDGVLLFVLLLVSRVVILAALGRATGGREFTTDASRLQDLSLDPAVIWRTGGAYATENNTQYPPLVGFVGAVLAVPLSRVFGPFYLMRAVYVGYELLAWPFFWLAVRAVGASARDRRILGLTLVLAPVSWITSVVMVQEEIVAGLILVLAGWLALTNRLGWAAFACGVGVVASKIFFLVPLLALVAGPPGRGMVGRAAAGGLPVGLVYGPLLYLRHRHGLGVPLASFAPYVPFGITFWTPLLELTPLSAAAARSASGLMALAAGVGVLAWGRGRVGVREPVPLLRLAVVMTLVVFFFFYHVNPEYYFMVAPLLLAVFPWRAAAAGAWVTLSLAWGINFFYGVGAAVAAGQTNAFVRLYRAIFPFNPLTLERLTIYAFVAANAATIVVLLRQIKAPVGGDAGEGDRPARGPVSE